MTSDVAPRLALSVTSAAGALETSENQVRELIQQGRLSAFRISDTGRKLRVPVSSIQHFIDCRVAAERGDELQQS